jgi:(R,R)-butanediol dehydrogenase/meso-butanediol dehydrogenase/diacetyl reductase
MAMPAVRWHDRRDVRVEDVPEPGPPPSGMVTIAVNACGICGTDVSEYLRGPILIRRRPHPLTGQAAPVTLGHEFVGRIAAAADGEPELLPGQRVVVDACWRCQRCPFCLRGDYHLCLQGGSIGLHSDGGLAPMVQVPSYTVVPVPDSVSDTAAALTEPLAVGLHASDRAGVSVGAVTVVVGFGPVGAASAIFSQLAGARVLVVEALAGRRDVAARLGFDEVLDPERLDVRREVRGRTQGLGADAAFDCTGRQSLLPLSLELIRRGGTVVLTGLGEPPAPVDTNRIVLFERRIVGSLGYRHDLPRVVELLASGVVPAEDLVTDEIPLEVTVARGLEALAAEPEKHFKVLVRCS